MAHNGYEIDLVLIELAVYGGNYEASALIYCILIIKVYIIELYGYQIGFCPF